LSGWSHIVFSVLCSNNHVIYSFKYFLVFLMILIWIDWNNFIFYFLHFLDLFYSFLNNLNYLVSYFYSLDWMFIFLILLFSFILYLFINLYFVNLYFVNRHSIVDSFLYSKINKFLLSNFLNFGPWNSLFLNINLFCICIWLDYYHFSLFSFYFLFMDWTVDFVYHL